MKYINLEIIPIYLFLILIFFSITCLGKLINKKFLKIIILNFYENFIIGISFIVLYLQIHIIFLPINLLTSSILIILLSFSLIANSKEILNKINFKFLISFCLCFFIIINSNVFPYYYTLYDYGLYHNTYLNWLNQESLTLGLANLHFRFGYSGSSYLLGAFFNFYPYFGSSYIFTSSIFFTFLIFLLIDKINFLKNDYSNIFNALIIYVVLKYIFVESLSDVSSDKIASSLLIFITYNLINNSYSKNKNNHFLSLISMCVLVSMGPSVWFIVFLLMIYFLWEYHPDIKINYKIFFYGTSICLLFGIINFLKSGNLFYPLIFPIFDTFFTIYGDEALYQIKNYPKGYPEGLEWILPKLKITIVSNNFVILYLLSTSLLILTFFTKHKVLLLKDGIVLKLTSLFTLAIIFWFFNAPVIRYAKIYFWISFIIILSFYFKTFIKTKFYSIFFILIYFYSAYSSLDNLAINRSFVSEEKAKNKHILNKKKEINDGQNIYLNDLNYTHEKFHIPNLPTAGNIDNLIYEKRKLFPRIFFDK